MKAAVWHGIKDVRVKQVEIPEISANQVKIKVAWAGICGSDLNAYLNGLNPDIHPVTKQKPPLILGHEFSGKVIEIGKNVEDLCAGDRVTVEPLIYCNVCHAYKEGFFNQCSNIGFIGLNCDGGFAEYVIVDMDKVHVLPDSLSYEEGALVEPTAVSYYAVKESKIKPGDSIAIFGAGPIGLLTLISAKVAGASQIIVVDIVEDRLHKAKELGASSILSGDRDDLVEQIIRLTDGGVNIAYECAGVQTSLSQAISSLKHHGEVMAIALFSDEIKVNLKELMRKSTSITSTLAYKDIFPEVINMIETGTLDVKPIITKKIELDNIVKDGFKPLIQDKKQVKILVRPS